MTTTENLVKGNRSLWTVFFLYRGDASTIAEPVDNPTNFLGNNFLLMKIKRVMLRNKSKPPVPLGIYS